MSKHTVAVNMIGTATVGDAPDLANIEAEQAVIAAVLMRNDLAEELDLSEEHFAEPIHRVIWRATAETIAAGHRATPVTLKPALEALPDVAQGLTVPAYMIRLVASAPSYHAAQDCARQIADFAARRAVVQALDDARAAIHQDMSASALAHIEALESSIGAIAEQRDTAQSATLSDAVDAAVTSVNAAMMRGGDLAGMSTGLLDLDRKLGGLARSDLIIVAGRPGMGKTSLAIGIADAIAKAGVITDDGESIAGAVAVFSMEMSSQQLGHRLLASEAGLDGAAMRRGQLRRADGLTDTGERYDAERDREIQQERFRVLTQAAQRLAERPVYIDESGGLTVQQLAARARRMKRKHGIQLIVIDYIQLMRSSRYGGRNAELTEITTGLKALAKELDVPIVALSQLSRAVENRDDKRPQLSDLRESGAIEQDADIVLFVYREEYYLERAKPPPDDFDAMNEHDARLSAARGKAEIIIGKQRHGPTGIVNVAFDAPTVRFHNLAHDGGRS